MSEENTKVIPEEEEVGDQDDDGYIGSTIRVFLSYSAKNKELSGQIKEQLEKYGLDVFLAHEDISPSKEWQDVVLQHLDSTDIFIPIITSDFKQSDWADQESGIAFEKKKLIISLSIDNNPYGFLGKYQALRFKSDSIKESCGDIFNVIKNNERFKKGIIDSLINIFEGVRNWEHASDIAELLLDFETMTDEQINSIAKATIINDQIYKSFNALPKLFRLFKNHSNLDSELSKQLELVGIK